MVTPMQLRVSALFKSKFQFLIAAFRTAGLKIAKEAENIKKYAADYVRLRSRGILIPSGVYHHENGGLE